MDGGNAISLLSDFPTLRNLFSGLNDVIHFPTTQMYICSNNNWSWNTQMFWLSPFGVCYFIWSVSVCWILSKGISTNLFTAWIYSIPITETKSRNLQHFMLLNTFKSEHKKACQCTILNAILNITLQYYTSVQWSGVHAVKTVKCLITLINFSILLPVRPAWKSQSTGYMVHKQQKQ